MGGRLGHIAAMDWREGRLYSEIQVKETVRAVRWLHDESLFAVAQKKYVYIYDKAGLEIHCLKKHIEVTHMEFLPYHFLLTTVVCPPDTNTLMKGKCRMVKISRRLNGELSL